MNNKTIMKGAGVLLLTAVLLLSATAVTANTNKITSMNPGVGTHKSSTSRDIIWDNDLSYENLLACQKDPTYGELGSDADDFQLTATQEVGGVTWIGGYWNGNPGAAGWEITIYADSSGPGAVLWGPTTFPYASCHEVFVEQVGTSYYYQYNVTLSPTFPAQAGVKYWIGWQGQQTFPPQSGIAGHALVTLNEMNFKSVYFGYPNWVPGSTVFGTPYDLAYQLTSNVPPPPPKVPDLSTQGSLAWTKVKAGATVTGTFQVGNIGDNGSLLNWKVDSFPAWGNWTFTPNAGTGLASGTWTTVSVSVVAPPDKKKTFNGTVKIVNTDNASDFSEITVSLVTPVNQGMHGQSLLERLFERFPNAFPILRQILGY